MGILDALLGFGTAAGVFVYYRSIFNEYDDESLVDEFFKLWRLRYSCAYSDDDEIRMQVIKTIIDERGLFDFN